MADIDPLVIEFLETYNLLPSHDGIMESEVNAILTSHKEDYETWLKCPDWLKTVFSGKIPSAILSEIAKDPNFTEADIVKIVQKYERNNELNQTDEQTQKHNPYSVIPYALSQNPAYEELCACGVKFTATHAAITKLQTARYERGGYSNQSAEKIASEYALRNALLAKIEEIKTASSLSQQQKAEQIELLNRHHTNSRKREGELKIAAFEQSKPEALLITVLATADRNSDDYKARVDYLISRVIEMDHIDLLKEQMHSVKYKMRVKDDAKVFLAKVLKEHNINIPQDISALEDREKILSARGIPYFQNPHEKGSTSLSPQKKSTQRYLTDHDKVVAMRMGKKLDDMQESVPSHIKKTQSFISPQIKCQTQNSI